MCQPKTDNNKKKKKHSKKLEDSNDIIHSNTNRTKAVSKPYIATVYKPTGYVFSGYNTFGQSLFRCIYTAVNTFITNKKVLKKLGGQISICEKSGSERVKRENSKSKDRKKGKVVEKEEEEVYTKSRCKDRKKGRVVNKENEEEEVYAQSSDKADDEGI